MHYYNEDEHIIIYCIGDGSTVFRRLINTGCPLPAHPSSPCSRTCPGLWKWRFAQ